MNIKKLLIPLITLMITACGGNGNSGSGSIIDISSIEESIIDNSSIVDTSSYEMPIINFDPADAIISGGTYGGFFTEINSGRTLSSHSDFELTFDSSKLKNPAYTVIISNDKLAQIEKNDSTHHKFILKTLDAGDFILKIYDSDKMLVYRNIVHVRDPYTKDTIGEGLFNVEYFVSDGFLGEWRMTFLTYEPELTGVLSGGDDYEANVSFTFTANYVEYQEFRDCFLFTTTVTESNSRTEIYGFLVSRCCDVIYVYYMVDETTDALLTYLLPVNIEE